MEQPPDDPPALPAVRSAGASLVLSEMLRTRKGAMDVSPEIRFLAMLAIRKPLDLRRVDVEQLAAAMISWGQRHLRSGAGPPPGRHVRTSDADPARGRSGHRSPGTLGAVDLFGGFDRVPRAGVPGPEPDPPSVEIEWIVPAIP